MIMQEVRKRGYKVFLGVEDERKRSTLENAIKYVDLLAAQAQVDVTSWPVLEVFHNENTGTIHTDKAKLNQAFFNWAKTQRVSTSRLTAQRRQALNSMSDNFKQIRRDRLKLELQQKLRDVAHYSRHFDNAMLAAAKTQAMLSAMNQNQANEMAQALEEVLSDGWYHVDEITSEAIRLLTPEIVLSHVNPSQKVDVRVPVGSFLVEFQLMRGSLRVFRHKNTFPPEEPDKFGDYRFHGTYYHPHVNHEGRVCFGEINQSVMQAIGNFDIKAVFTATRQVLTTYCDQSPYVHLFTMRDYLEHLNKKEKENGKEKQDSVGVQPSVPF